MILDRLLPGHADPLPDPHAINDRRDMAEAAALALAARRKDYPGLIAQGKLDGSEAAADLAAWEALAAEWHWICTGRGSPPCPSTLFDRIEALDLALDRAEAALVRAPRDAALRRRRDLYAAMRWHLSRLRFGDPAIHFNARVEHHFRARLVICPACECRREDPRVAACTRRDCGLPDLPATPEAERTAA